MKLHSWVCVLACFLVAISDQLQSFATCNTTTGQFEGSAVMGGFVQNGCDLACSVFLCNLKHYAYKHTEKHLKITVKLIGMCCQWSCVGFVNISCKVLDIMINTI